MLKIFIFLSIFILNIFAQTITFKEEKFLNALQTSVYKDGKIDFKKDYIEVSYKNLSTSYIFFDDHFISKDNQTEQRLNYEDRVELNLFYKLINFIYKDKKEFIKSLNKAKNNIIEYEKMEELEYGKNNTSIHNILLALSIFDDDNSSRFNFNAYSDKKQNWSLEHIFPQTPKLDNGLLNCNDIKSINELSNNKDIEEFRNNIFLENKDINLDTEYKSLIKILEEGKAKKVTSTQISIIEELIKVESLHHIGNMALLSVGDNASMSNNMFNEKRLNLAKRVSKGSFIPKHTFDVFSKLTDFNQSNVMNENLKIWTLQDITTHQLWMKQRIEKIIGLEL
mgnify:CR=1 FL=1